MFGHSLHISRCSNSLVSLSYKADDMLKNSVADVKRSSTSVIYKYHIPFPSIVNLVQSEVAIIPLTAYCHGNHATSSQVINRTLLVLPTPTFTTY